MKKVLYILGEFEDSDIEWLVRAGRKETIRTGQTIIREDVPLDTFYIVIEGAFSVWVGGPPREIANIGAGEILGEISYVDSRSPTATVTAKLDSLVLAVPRSSLSTKLETDLPFAARFYRAVAVFLADRLRDTVDQLGYGTEEKLDAGPFGFAPGEFDLGQLHTMSQAGVRFERLLRRMQEF